MNGSRDEQIKRLDGRLTALNSHSQKHRNDASWRKGAAKVASRLLSLRTHTPRK